MCIVFDDNIEGRVCWHYEVCPYFCHSQPQWCKGSATSSIPHAFRYINLRLAKMQCIKWAKDSTGLEKTWRKQVLVKHAEIWMDYKNDSSKTTQPISQKSPSSAFHHSQRHFSVCFRSPFHFSLSEKINKMITLQWTVMNFSPYAKFGPRAIQSGTPWREVTNGPEFQFQPRTLKILRIVSLYKGMCSIKIGLWFEILNVPCFTQKVICMLFIYFVLLTCVHFYTSSTCSSIHAFPIPPAWWV